jgi:hypothetical protein
MLNKMSKNYFTQETESAIIAYNLSSDFDERSKIYNDKIHYAFFKLTQNIIHTFKFYHTEVENIEDLQHEIITFLLSKMHLFHHSRSIQDRLVNIITKEFKEEYTENFTLYTNDAPHITQDQINIFLSKLEVSEKCMDKLKKLTPPKAYSYFGTIVKRWLILYNDKNYKKKINSTPVSTLEDDPIIGYTIEENNSPSDRLSHNDKIELFVDLYVDYCTNNIYELFPKENDAKVADAVLELFRKREYFNNLLDGKFNKKALYIHIREIIDVKTPKITKISDRLYTIFKRNYIFYLESGYIKFH